MDITPTPWAFIPRAPKEVRLKRVHWQIGQATGAMKGVGIVFGDDETNAAFIVRACNAHDALVHALQEIVQLSVAEGRETFESEIAHAALAKVQT